jgi:outer membrane protein, heavy metal efflux system
MRLIRGFLRSRGFFAPVDWRQATFASLVASSLALSSCVSVPREPIDPTESARRLTSRSMQDLSVAQALQKAGLSMPEQSGWGLDALTIVAWTLRPDVLVAAQDIAASSAAERVARQVPNPSVSLGPGYVAHNANHNVSPWVMSTAVGFTIETGGKRRIRTAQARATTQTIRWQFAETLWRARQEVRNALLSRQLAQASLELANEEARLREAFSAWVDTQLRFGAGTQSDRLAAQTNLAQAQAQLRTVRGDLAAADAELAASVGVVGENLPLSQIVTLSIDDLPDPEQIPQQTWRDWGVMNRLSVNHSLADYEVAEEDLRLAIAQQYPDLNLGPGYTFDKGDSIINLALGLTPPLLHGQRAQIDQAIASRRKSAIQFEASQAQALADVDTSLTRYRATYAALLQARDAEYSLHTAATSAQRRLTLGAADRGELLRAQLEAIVGRRATLDALRATLAALDAMEASVQRPIWPASTLAIEPPDRQAMQ